MTKFDLPQVTLCGWQDIKIQLLIMNYLEGHGHSKGSAPETHYCLLHISWNIELFASKLCDGTLLKAGITYNKFVSLSSRSHVGFSFSRNDCVFHIIWTDEPFASKLCMVLHHHKLESCTNGSDALFSIRSKWAFKSSVFVHSFEPLDFKTTENQRYLTMLGLVRE